MTGIDTQGLQEVEALMKERQRFEGWMRSLFERRNTTSTHVFERVKADYEGRLSAVIEQLSSRAGAIQGSISALKEQLDELQARETQTSDERAEAELRAAVGEFTQDEWEEVRNRTDELISKVSGDRLRVTDELERLERILEVALRPAPQIGGTPASGHNSGGAAPAQAGTPARQSQSAPRQSTDPAQRHVAAASDKRPASRSGEQKDFDELAFLSSVIEPALGDIQIQHDEIEMPLPPANTRADSRGGGTPEGVPTATPGASGLVRSATPLITEPVHSGSESTESSTRAREEPRKDDQGRWMSGSVPAYLKDVPKEVNKSLKCQECGTLNYPTEWYCERCGGELAAL